MVEHSSISKVRKYCFTAVKNSPLVLFRMLFGAIMLMEFVVALKSGWVKGMFVNNPFRFTFIGFEFLQHLRGDGMYVYYAVACLAAICVSIGLLYRYTSLLLAVLWTLLYFAQKSQYNNHYYLMLLLCWAMVFVPANKRASLDVKYNLVQPTDKCYQWHIHFFITQTAIVYVYAAIAKLYPDWLHAMPAKVWFANKTDNAILSRIFGHAAFPYILSYGGILFDFLIVPALLWKRTRVAAVIGLLLFHQFNEMAFSIGVFPFLALSLTVFFFPASSFDSTVGLVKNSYLYAVPSLSKQTVTISLLTVYFIWQLVVPFRHHLYKGDVVWTEEGHRMSWRMMLRSKRGKSTITVKDKQTGKTWIDNTKDKVMGAQYKCIATRPDFVWQYAQKLKKEYKEKGINIAVYANCQCSVNGRPYRHMIDTTVDLANTQWQHYAHNSWVLTDYK